MSVVLFNMLCNYETLRFTIFVNATSAIRVQTLRHLCPAANLALPSYFPRINIGGPSWRLRTE